MLLYLSLHGNGMLATNEVHVRTLSLDTVSWPCSDVVLPRCHSDAVLARPDS